ncbi:MAG: hypothetical protein INH37_17855 [Myxococcaceae bacterium]|jgi:hypothetical protein|nr:hypothetical protein [Myxococcaceae bacterium]
MRRDEARFPLLRAVCHPASRTAVACISAQLDYDFDKTWPQKPKTCFFGFC